MTNKELLAQIRAEIERRMIELAKDKSIDLHDTVCRTRELNLLLTFLDTLAVDAPEVDLEKDATQFCFDKGFNITPYQAKTIAQHFYKLGKSK